MLDRPEKTEGILLRTKIAVPFIPPECIHRHRLIERIDRGVKGPLTLLVAPAGYGKTILLTDWAKTACFPVCWFRVDPNDNDLNRFFNYLLFSLHSIEPTLGDDALEFLQSGRDTGLESGLTLLINEIADLKMEITLILDDFQLVTNPSILQSMNFLLKNLPQNFHVIISSRNDPELDLVFFRVKNRIVELAMNDLRFTGREVELFFRQAMHLDLPRETILELENRTDGWIAGLQLAAITMRDESNPSFLLANFQGDAHYLVDFLAEEVLDRQPEEIRQFLLRSSILYTMNGALCEAVVAPDSQPGYGSVLLNKLERERLFISALDEQHEWFQYHQLFRDFLRHIQMEINPAEIPVLQKRASRWCEENGMLDDAFHYALASGDLELAREIIERNLEMVIRSGEIFQLTRWLDQLPREMVQEHPILIVFYTWGLIASYDLDAAAYWVEVLQGIVYSLDKNGGDLETTSFPAIETGFGRYTLKNLHGGLAFCQSTLSLLIGEEEKAAEYSKKAATYMGKDFPFLPSMLALDDSLYYILSGDSTKAIESLNETIQIARKVNNLLVMFISNCQLAEMQCLQGQLSRAWKTLQKVHFLSTGSGGKPLSLAALADIGLGEILLERNMLAEAREYLERGVESTGLILWLGNLDGLVSLARLRQAMGDFAGSQAIIEKASELALNTESSQWDDVFVSSIAIRLAIYREDIQLAEKMWVQTAYPDLLQKIPLGKYPYHVYEYLVLTQARLLIIVGKNRGFADYLIRASELLESLILEAERFNRMTSLIEIKMLQALILSAYEDNEKAINLLRSALALGEPEGFMRIYLDLGRSVYDLFELAAKDSQDSMALPSHAFIQRLLNALREELKIKKSVAQPEKKMPALTRSEEDDFQILLSNRELEVLVLIAEGKTNQEISAQLYLALNTVKRHAYNIYSKLGVQKRTQAVSKARRMGLIP